MSIDLKSVAIALKFFKKMLAFSFFCAIIENISDMQT